MIEESREKGGVVETKGECFETNQSNQFRLEMCSNYLIVLNL